MLERTGLNKLEGFGPVYVINMEKSIDRKQYIEEHFNKYKILQYHFVDAIDGSSENINDMLVTPVGPILSDGEIACSISHIKAINKWLQESDSEYAIITEDDVSFETTDFWDFTWKEFLDSINKHYDVLQLAIINNFKVNPRLHLREFSDWSASAYLIKRSFAERLIKRHLVDEKYFLGTSRVKALSEGIVYTQGVCYSIPLFTYSTDLGSNLNPSHVKTMHLNSKNQVLEYWKSNKRFKLDLL
jgi:hypothetical protein